MQTELQRARDLGHPGALACVVAEGFGAGPFEGSEIGLWAEAVGGRVQYVRRVSRLWLLARRYAFDLLIVIGAIESALEVALSARRGAEPQTTLWFAVPAVAVIVLALLGRRRFPFAAPVAVWVLAAAVSFVDGRLTVDNLSVFAAGMAASFLLGNLADAVQGRIGLAVVLGGAAIVVYNDPGHAAGEYIFVPVLFAIAWLAGFALRERAAQAEAAEERAAQAEHAVFEERVRIARELHDVVAHHVSMMGVQAGAARLVHRPRSAGRRRTRWPRSRPRAGRRWRSCTACSGSCARRATATTWRPNPASAQLPRLAASMRDSELAVEVSVEGEARSLPPTVDVSAYRIVQEALTNTLKHSGASRADVHVRYWPDELEVEIVDDGRAQRRLVVRLGAVSG